MSAIEILQLSGVSKSYSTENIAQIVLQHISFSIAPQEILVIMGESGCGKSTLAKLILGLEKPDKGKILICGKDVSNLSYGNWRKIRPMIQGVFQDAGGTLNTKHSVFYNLYEPLRNIGRMKKNNAKSKIYQLFHELGLEQSILKTPVAALSGGEQRRISFIRAILVKPQILVLDEVTNGLDIYSKKQLLHVLAYYKNQCGGSILLATHDIEFAMKIADRILYMEHGQITKEGIRNKEEVLK